MSRSSAGPRLALRRQTVRAVAVAVVLSVVAAIMQSCAADSGGGPDSSCGANAYLTPQQTCACPPAYTWCFPDDANDTSCCRPRDVSRDTGGQNDDTGGIDERDARGGNDRDTGGGSTDDARNGPDAGTETCEDLYICGDGVCEYDERYCDCDFECATPPEALAAYEQPQIIIFAVSGHCFAPSCAFGVNHEYLDADGTIESVATVFSDAGYSVGWFAHSDEFYNRDADDEEYYPSDPLPDPAELGFLQMLSDMAAVRDLWVIDSPNPSRIIVMAHSHGTVWAHTAVELMHGLPVDVLIDIDGESLGWESDELFAGAGDLWMEVIDVYSFEEMIEWSFDIGDPANSIEIPRVTEIYDIEDIVADNVAINLELQSSPDALISPIHDAEPNWRFDGSTLDIYGFQSDEGHTGIDDPGSDGVEWIKENLRMMYGL